MKADERAFEESIEAWLLDEGGYERGDPGGFDAELGLDPACLLAFLDATQGRGCRAACCALRG